jgi:hypothetical protein
MALPTTLEGREATVATRSISRKYHRNVRFSQGFQVHTVRAWPCAPVAKVQLLLAGEASDTELRASSGYTFAFALGRRV